MRTPPSRARALFATLGRATTDGIALDLKMSRETARKGGAVIRRIGHPNQHRPVAPDSILEENETSVVATTMPHVGARRRPAPEPL
jgi:hypothetical protein